MTGSGKRHTCTMSRLSPTVEVAPRVKLMVTVSLLARTSCLTALELNAVKIATE